MHCKKCGSALTDDAAFCPSCGAKAKKRSKKPFFLFRFFLNLMSFVLYLVLMVSLLATSLLADAKILTSSGGIEAIMTHLVSPDQAPPATAPAMGAVGVVQLSSAEVPGDAPVSEDTLVEQIREMAQQILGEDTPITTEQIHSFIENSTLMEFVADKAASTVENILKGEADSSPLITTEEILQLIDENEQVIEDTFQIELTEKSKQEMSAQIDDALADADMNALLQESIVQALQTTVPGTNGMTVQDLLGYVEKLAQPPVIALGAALCLMLMGLVMWLNYYQLHRGLRWIAGACITAGSLLATPLALVQFSPALVSGILPETGETLQLLSGAAAVIAPVHYGMLAVGVVLTLVSFVWRMFARNK